MRDLAELLEVVTGYQRAAVVTAAWRLGVFDVLDDVAQPVDEVAARLGTRGPGSLRALLDALSASGLVCREPGGYRAAGPVGPRLGRAGDLGAVVGKEGVFARLWQDLDRVVREDRPALAPWRERLSSDPGGCLAFLEALDVLARLTAPDLDRLPALAPGRAVVDVGGGLGSWARRLADAGSTVTLVELEPVTGWAAERLDDLTGSVTVVAADAVTQPACGVGSGSHDAALVSHLLHDLPDGAARAVLAGAAQAVRPGGHVVVSEFAGDAGPAGFGALFDVMMRLETGAAARPLAGLVEMMTRAGLEAVERAPFDDPATVLVGRVPADPGAHETVGHLVGEDGAERARYPRSHPATGDVHPILNGAPMVPGPGLVTATVKDVTVGLLVCSELWLPEVSRVLVLRGAEVLLAPAGGGFGPVARNWRLMARARTVENQCHVALTQNLIGEETGTALLTGPEQDVAGSAVEQLVVGTLDLARARWLRDRDDSMAVPKRFSSLPGLLRARRPELYAELSEPRSGATTTGRRPARRPASGAEGSTATEGRERDPRRRQAEGVRGGLDRIARKGGRSQNGRLVKSGAAG